jgi:dCTP deaminase
MILTDREIQLALANRQIEITPPPDDDAYGSTSVDLTLDAPGEVWKQLPGQPIRPGAAGYSYASLTARKDVIPSLDGYTLTPTAFLLAWTRERISLPITSRLAARVEGKSSLARLGLGVHLTAPRSTLALPVGYSSKWSISGRTRSSSISACRSAN